MEADGTDPFLTRPSEGQPVSPITIFLSGNSFLHHRVAVGHVVHALVGRDAFPVRQQVDTDEIAALRQRRVPEPDAPHVGGTDFDLRIGDRVPDAMHVCNDVAGGQFAAQHRLVANDHAVDDFRIVAQ